MILVAGFVASEISSRRVIFVAACDTPIDPNSLSVQRRGDGAVLVRVRSKDRPGGRLPDAVFTFWLGDPQYEYWESQLGAGPTPPYSG